MSYTSFRVEVTVSNDLRSSPTFYVGAVCPQAGRFDAGVGHAIVHHYRRIRMRRSINPLALAVIASAVMLVLALAVVFAPGVLVNAFMG